MGWEGALYADAGRSPYCLSPENIPSGSGAFSPARTATCGFFYKITSVHVLLASYLSPNKY